MAVILILLTQLLNLYSALAGVGVTLFFIPVQICIANTFASVRTRTAQLTDCRIRHLSETIDGIGSVKAYGWEIPFFEYICSLRQTEVDTIQFSQVLRCVNWTLYFCIPPLAGFALFVVYWSTSGELALPKVFSSISLLQVLRTSMGRMWTRAMETGSEAIASSARIDLFLDLGSGLVADVRNCSASIEEDSQSPEVSDAPLLSIKKSSFSYPSKSEPVLSNIELSVLKGELLMVVGSVGAV